MNDKMTVESISAIKQYIAKSEQNVGRHKANVLVHANRKDYCPGTRVVYATVNGEVGQVIIEDLHTICSCCSDTFTTKESSFSFVSGTLRIKAKDSLVGEISINIT